MAAFKLGGGKKDPFALMRNRGLISPLYQKETIPSVQKIGEEIAEQRAEEDLKKANEKLINEYTDEKGNKVKEFQTIGKGSWEEAYERALEKGYVKEGESKKDYIARAQKESRRIVITPPEEGEQETEPEKIMPAETKTVATEIKTTQVGGKFKYNPNYLDAYGKRVPGEPRMIEIMTDVSGRVSADPTKEGVDVETSDLTKSGHYLQDPVTGEETQTGEFATESLPEGFSTEEEYEEYLKNK